MKCSVIIPARNEEFALPAVIASIPDWVSTVIVVDNGSTDDTADVARACGAQVVHEPRAGYGQACLTGIAHAGETDIIVFLDGDASDHPEHMANLIRPIIAGCSDLVIASRTRGNAQPGSLTLPQRFGNAVACKLIRMIWGGSFTDLGPFRAIRRTALERLDMQAPTFGWTVEMQVRALKRDLRVHEIPTDYKRRIGKSKISGTVKGVFLAGVYILGTIAVEAADSVASRMFRKEPRRPAMTKRHGNCAGHPAVTQVRSGPAQL